LDFWKDQIDKASIEIRFTACKDYSLGYLDFIDTRLSKDSFEKVKIPLTILASGNGSFSQPF